MKKKVTIVDDTFRRNLMSPVTRATRDMYFEVHKKLLPDAVKMLPVVDRQGRKMQEKVQVRHHFEGARLRHAVTRAKRWMRSGRFPGIRPPYHIALFLAAFHKADPKGFKNAMA